MRRALHQGGDNALNLYSTTAGPYLGAVVTGSIPDQIPSSLQCWVSDKLTFFL